MPALNQAQQTRKAMLIKQQAKANKELAALNAMEGDDDEVTSETEDETTAETEGDDVETETDEEEASAVTEGDDVESEEDDDEEVEARVQLFQNLPEASSQQTLAAELARDGTKLSRAKQLLKAASRGASLEARTDFGVPRGGGGSGAAKAAGTRLLAAAKTHKVKAT
jgi:hypothetical protein